MVTLEECSEIFISLRRIRMRCLFKYSRTSNQNYLAIANEIVQIMKELKNKDIIDINFNRLSSKNSDLYLRMRIADNE